MDQWEKAGWETGWCLALARIKKETRPLPEMLPTKEQRNRMVFPFRSFPALCAVCVLSNESRRGLSWVFKYQSPAGTVCTCGLIYDRGSRSQTMQTCDSTCCRFYILPINFSCSCTWPPSSWCLSWLHNKYTVMGFFPLLCSKFFYTFHHFRRLNNQLNNMVDKCIDIMYYTQN